MKYFLEAFSLDIVFFDVNQGFRILGQKFEIFFIL